MQSFISLLQHEDVLNLKLAKNFAVLDQLINIYLPDLSGHFEKESINSSLFSAAWFITLFTNS